MAFASQSPGESPTKSRVQGPANQGPRPWRPFALLALARFSRDTLKTDPTVTVATPSLDGKLCGHWTEAG